jgi:hypothetical protein
MRRLAAAALVAATLAVPMVQSASAARCGEPLDTIGYNAPEPVRSLYLKLCGV